MMPRVPNKILHLDQHLLSEIVRDLSVTETPIDMEMAAYLSDISSLGLSRDRFVTGPSISAPVPPIQMLGSVVMSIKKAAARSEKKSASPIRIPSLAAAAESEDRGAQSAGVSFLMESFNDLHEKVCGKGKKPSKLSHKAQAVLSSIAAAISRKLGITEPTALGLAVLVVLALGELGKKAFCRMTTAHQLKQFFG